MGLGIYYYWLLSRQYLLKKGDTNGRLKNLLFVSPFLGGLQQATI